MKKKQILLPLYAAVDDLTEQLTKGNTEKMCFFYMYDPNKISIIGRSPHFSGPLLSQHILKDDGPETREVSRYLVRSHHPCWPASEFWGGVTKPIYSVALFFKFYLIIKDGFVIENHFWCLR